MNGKGRYTAAERNSKPIIKLKLKMPIDDVVDITGLTREEIEGLNLEEQKAIWPE